MTTLPPQAKSVSVIAVAFLALLVVNLAHAEAPGDLDTSFDGDGKVTTDFGTGGQEVGQDLAIQSDDRIVVVGYNASGYSVARYNSDGSLDTSFDGDGNITSSALDSARAVAIQSDGKIVVAGSKDDPTWDFGLTRYNGNGSLDTSFGTNGKVITDFGDEETLTSMLIQPDGKIVVAGLQTDGPRFALARYNSNGSLDTSFDGDGKVTTDVGSTNNDNFDAAIAIQPDGKIVMVGASNEDFVVVRYDSAGSLDTSFDGDGKVTTDFSSSRDFASAVTIHPGGKIVVSGYAGTVALARYHSDGSLDTSFDGDGKLTLPIGGVGSDVIIQSDSKTVVASTGFDVIRVNDNGSLDTSFSVDGIASTDFSGSEISQGIAAQFDGRIVVAGGVNGFNDFGVARFHGLPLVEGYWSFDNHSDDESGNGNDGTPANGVGYAAGVIDQALNLDGVNDYVRIDSYSNFNGMNAFSLVAWIYPTEFNTHNSIISKVTPSRDFVFKLDGSGRLNAHFYDGGYRHCTSTETVSLSEWSHVAAVWTGTEWKLYLNGDPIRTCTHSSYAPPWTGTRMGIGTMNWSEFFTGEIDEVKVYNGALSEVAIKSHWSFDGHPDDEGGGGNDGTLVNGASYTTGLVDQAVDLDGVNDYVRIDSFSNFDDMSAFTLAAWIYPAQLNTHNSIISKVNPSRDFVLKLTGSGALNAHFYDGGYRHCTSTETVPVGEWSHVAAAWTGTEWRLYINGKLVKACDHNGYAPPWTGTRMGIGTMNWSEFFAGLIDEVRVYDVILTNPIMPN